MFDELNQRPDSRAGGNGAMAPKVGADIPAQTDRTPQAAAGAKVEDMFADTEPAKPAQFQPKAATSISALPSEEEQGQSVDKMRKILFLVSAASAVLVVAIGVYWGARWWLGQSRVDLTGSDLVGQEDEAVGRMDEVGLDDAEEGMNEVFQDDIGSGEMMADADSELNDAPAQDMDSDQDGLSDSLEMSLGLDINSSDTDMDGLYDREEVEIYNTDPLRKDTDGDGYSDGSEVKNGYNPNGEGRLFDPADFIQ